MIWVNIDKPTKKCTIHTSENCRHVMAKQETMRKEIGELKTNGGWVSFSSQEEVTHYIEQNFCDFETTNCKCN